MEFDQILGYVLSAAGGGGLTQLVNWRINRKKVKVEVQQSEIEVIAETVRSVYQPIIEQQNKTIEQQNSRISELDKEVQALRREKREMQDDYERKIAAIKEEYNKQIQSIERRMLDISRAVGYRAASHAKSSKKAEAVKKSVKQKTEKA